MDVIDRFLRAAEANPDHPAIRTAANSVTYGEFARRVRAFAAQFARHDAPRVLIALPQSCDAYAAILAAGLAGGCYTPLNLAAPEEKLRRIAHLLAPQVIVASGDLARALQVEAPLAALLDPADLDMAEPFVGRGTRHRLAYVLFTSGSTGLPKGVMVSRRALDHYVDWLATLGIGPDDRVSQHPNLAFDISATDFYGALCYGATLYPVAVEGDRLMPARMIAREKITVWNSVPSVVGLMMQARQVTSKHLATVRLFNFCGEPLLAEHLQAIFAARPDTLVQNTYGPTEATISMTALSLTADNYHAFCGDASVALGDPIPGMAIRLEGGTHPDEGEIVILGPQLAEGYWQSPDKTALAFRDFEVAGEAVRGYHTGDWAERHDGNVFFKERIDFQVKVRGYRIELDEVAAAIRACGWPVVCVVKRGEALAAVVERSPGQRFSEAALRASLAAKIEAHAIPETILEVDRMPRNDNDKLDRRAAAALLG